MSTAAFDVLAYAADARGSHRASLTSLEEPVPEALLGRLDYLRGRFTGTTSWLSLVLVTPTHKEPRITAFLSAWSYERYWMADAFAALARDPVPLSSSRTRRELLAERLAPLSEAVIANLHGTALTAVQMTERVIDGAVIDLLLEDAAASASAALRGDIERIRSVLARQQEFFTETAEERLSASPRAQRLARSRLTARAWPIGAERDPGGTARAFAALTASDPGWADALDARIDRLPGLAGLHLMRRSAGNPGRPVLRTPLRTAAAISRLAASASRRKG